MRNALLLSVCLFLLSACADMDEMFGDQRGGTRHYGDDANYGGYNQHPSGYGSYYPYGNASYPRERIYIIQPSNPCRGNSYRGYCYRNDEDYRRAREYDQSKGYDDAWYQKHRNYCAQNDCSRGRDVAPHDDNNRHDDHRNDDHRNDHQDSRGYDKHSYDKHGYDNDSRGYDAKDHDGDSRESQESQESEPDRQKSRNHYDGSYQNDGHSQRRNHYQSVTPASQDGHYDHGRVLDSQQKDQDNRQESSGDRGQSGYVSRHQDGEDRVTDPKSIPRAEAGNQDGALDQPIEHGVGRPDDVERDRGRGEMRHGSNPPVFVEPRESRSEPAFEPPVHEEPLMKREEPMMREPQPAFEPPVRHEEPPPRQEPARRPPMEEPEQAAPARVEAPPAEVPPIQ